VYNRTVKLLLDDDNIKLQLVHNYNETYANSTKALILGIYPKIYFI